MDRQDFTYNAKGSVAKCIKEKKVYNCEPKVPTNKKNKICDIFGKYVVPLITILFMSTYWSTGLYLYYYPTNEI
mgnify:CR=1 FL=1